MPTTATTYLCESGFSCLCEVKSRKRNSITPIDTLMRGAIKKDFNLQFGMLLDNMQQQKNIEDNFLNLLCALPCVILSADCSEIVFRKLLLI